MPKMKKRVVLGVTGGIASGKTAVMRLLHQARIPTISSDDLAHSCIRRGKPAYRAILRHFGSTILAPSREIDRPKLGQIVFAHARKRKALERMVHPCVVKGLKTFIKRHPRGLIALDIPLLFEARLQSLIDTIVVVYAPREMQIRRLISRNGLSRRDATQRLFAQLSMNHKRRRADILLDNSGTLESLRDQIKKKILTLKEAQV
jgi:dephospho-CoA kinase